MLRAILFVISVVGYTSSIAGTVYQCGDTFQDRPCNKAENQKMVGEFTKDPPVNAIDLGIRTGQVAIGMTPEQVVMVWGDPNSKRNTVAGSGLSTQWCWHRDEGPQCVYFTNGKVTGWN